MNETPAQNSSSLEAPISERLRELAFLFLKLGTISFGGPAAHIAMMEGEIVRKRRWVTHEQFLDMLGASNLIPGPTSTEMAINTGFVRAGWAGLCVAGASFILPAALITGAFAWAYLRFGNLPQAAAMLGGIKPAVVAVIAIAISRLGKVAVKDVGLAVLGVLSLAGFFAGLNPIAILFGGGLVGMLVRRAMLARAASAPLVSIVPVPHSFLARMIGESYFGYVTAAAVAPVAAGIAIARPSVGQVALFFLKLGAVLYGGGYVLLAFLEQGLVRQHAWLTQQQLLDSVAIGQFTPGPVFSTATFIGYLLAGAPGALVATVGIFLPSFFYVALLAPVLFRLRQSGWISAFLDSVNVCAVALMFGVTIRLGVDALSGWSSWVIAGLSLVVLLRWKVSPAWVVLGGGVAGVLLGAVR